MRKIESERSLDLRHESMTYETSELSSLIDTMRKREEERKLCPIHLAQMNEFHKRAARDLHGDGRSRK